MKLSFVLMTEFMKYQQVYTLLKMIEAAKAKNHEIRGVFLYSTSVINLKKNIEPGKKFRNIPKVLESLVKDGVPIFACQAWADNYGLFAEDIIDGVEILGLGELSNMTSESDKLIVFGSRT
jgi:sulfur relay (sulfurtransferase) complex TusBCD TusD component (DsrE family)